MEQTWKFVPSTSGRLLASRDGRVMSINGTVLATRTTPPGYRMVSYKVNGRQFSVYVHRLVAEAYLGVFPDRPEVNHINGIKHDNRLENLEWTDRRGNILHASRVLGRVKKGETHSFHKLTEDAVRSARAEYALGGVSTRALGVKHGVTQAVMAAAIRGQSWRHVA